MFVSRTRHRRLGVVALAREHVVPLKNLVEDDAVHESAQSDAKQDSRGTRPRDGFVNRVVVRSGARGADSHGSGVFPHQ